MLWLRRCVILLALALCPPVLAQESLESQNRFVADIELQTEADLSELLSRAGELFLEGKVRQEDGAVVLVLHGPVLRTLLKPNYAQSPGVVNQAASLAALGVLDIKACRSWMSSNGVDESELQPFVQVVSSGPSEVRRLVRDEGYLFF